MKIAVALGGLLTVIGALWTLLAGGCTLVFLGQVVVSALQSSSANRPELFPGFQALPLVLLFGAAGLVPGGLILWGGISILRREHKRG